MKYNKRDVLIEIRRVVKLLNKDKLSSREYDKHSKISINITRSLFNGSWNQAIKEAGLIPNYKKISQEELIAEIQKVAKNLNQNYISLSDFKKYSKLSVSGFNGKKWNDIVESAGLKPIYGRKEILDDIAFKRMLEIFNKNQKICNSIEYRNNNQPNYYYTMRNRYNGWKNVMDRFYQWLIKQNDIEIDFTVEDLISYSYKTKHKK